MPRALKRIGGAGVRLLNAEGHLEESDSRTVFNLGDDSTVGARREMELAVVKDGCPRRVARMFLPWEVLVMSG